MRPVSRRSLFDHFFQTKPLSDQVNSSLDEYTQPLTRPQVMHLLRRATFGTSIELINRYEGKRASEIVDDLFNIADRKVNPQAPFYVNAPLKNTINLSGKEKDDENQKKEKQVRDYNQSLGEWWIALMKKDADSILEKMVLFWHDHFATQYAICDGVPATAMYNQQDLFRKNYAGNFRTLLEKMSVDDAMLRYLNGKENIAEAPNENYARELLELFSIGVGNYTEQDVREAAKILTGWKVTMYNNEGYVPYKPYLVPQFFDKNNKSFMGETFTVNYEVNEANVYENSVKKLIATILSKKSKEASVFISKKLYEYFIYSNTEKIDAVFIDQMSKMLLNNQFEFKPLLKAIFKSQHFYDESIIGSQLKSPAETIIGITRHLNYTDTNTRNVMIQLGLELLNPPNVAGWKGYRNWVSTKTLPSTIFYIKEIINSNTNQQIGQWALTYSKVSDFKAFTTNMMELFLVQTKDEARIKKFTAVLLANAPDYEWAEIIKNQETLGQRVKGLLYEIIKAPDFYLF